MGKAVGNTRCVPVIERIAEIAKRFNTAALGAAGIAHTALTPK